MKLLQKVGNTAIDLFDLGWGYAQSDIIAIEGDTGHLAQDNDFFSTWIHQHNCGLELCCAVSRWFFRLKTNYSFLSL